MARAPRSLAFWLCCWMAATLAAGGGSARAAEPARHASTPAERQARGEEAARNFMQGRYEEALATFLDLYIQSDGRPEYLRNIGRCQQKLKQYPRAIESFKDYLRRARRLDAAEKNEVQGFISEMETEMKTGGTAASGGAPAVTVTAPSAIPAAPPATATAPARAPAPTTAPAPAPAPAPPAQAYRPAPAAGRSWPAPAPPATAPSYGPQPPTAYGQQRPTPPASSSTVAYNGASSASLAAPAPVPAPPDLVTRAPEAGSAEAHPSPLRVVGIASLVAAAVAAGGGTLALMSARSIHDDAIKNGCPTFNSKSYCDSKANAVDSANLISKILYIGAGVVGIAGITMIVAAPSATPDGRVSLAMSGRF